MKQRFYSILLATLLCLAGNNAWAQAFEIGSAADLKAWAQQVGTNPNAVLTTDIDMDGQGWTPLEGYMGTFDGAGHTIKNLGEPLFKTTASGVVIQDLTLEGTIEKSSGDEWGAFISYHSGNTLTMTNCVNRTDITAPNTRNVGGFIAHVANVKASEGFKMTNCVNYGTIVGYNPSELPGGNGSHYGTGGIIGWASFPLNGLCAIFTDCVNNGEIQGAPAGGIIGWCSYGNNSHKQNFINCHNTGKITGTAQLGGLVGNIASITYFTDCSNTGEITATAQNSNTGGLLGLQFNYGTPNFTNCSNTGAISGIGRVGGFVGMIYTNYGLNISYCYNEGNITGAGTSSVDVGGFIGRFDGGSRPSIKNSYNTGNLECAASTVRAFAGYAYAPVNVSGSWNTGIINSAASLESGFETLTHNPGTITSSFDLANAQLNPAHGTPEGYEESWLANGHFCFALNGNSHLEPTWFQTLGTDATPVFDSTHGIVYGNTEYLCDGKTPKNDPPTYTFSNTPDFVNDPHVFEEGFCTVCGNPNLEYLPMVDGAYQLSTPAHLIWFAKYVNTYKTKVNGALTADIDMSSVENFESIGLFRDAVTVDEVQLPQISRSFTGVFDGQGHVIKNLTVTSDAHMETGLFGRLASDALVKNLGVVDASVTTDHHLGRAGIIAGFNWNSTVENCYTTGNLSISVPEGGEEFGGIVGGVSGSKVVNCWTSYEKLAKGGTITNSYAAADISGILGTGELCYKLNGESSENPVWFQTLDEDEYPVPNPAHGTVYLAVDQHCDGSIKGEPSFSNTEGTGTRDPHNFVDGFCDFCHTADMNFVEQVNGFYQIGTAAQLRWFSAVYNQKLIERTSNAVLTADIDLEGEPFEPIGRFGGSVSADFLGHLDGKAHVVSNVNIVGEGNEELGFFGRISMNSGAWVKNLGLYNVTVSGSNTNPGGLVGFLGLDASVENCFVAGQVSLNDGGSVGGLVGTNNGTIINSWTTYTGVQNTQGSWGTAPKNCYSLSNTPNIEQEQLTGELCYKLNGSSIANPVWFQNLGEDSYPLPDPARGIVYTIGDGNFASVTEATFTNMRDDIVSAERDYCASAVAHQGTIDLYLDEIDKWAEAENLADFLAAYIEGSPLKDDVKASEQAYKTYIDACENLIAQLAQNTNQSSYRKDIEEYLDKENPVDPGTYPNGSYGYILETHTLTNDEVTEEIEYANMLMNRFLVSDPTPGTEMTVLLRNPDFTKGWEGWETEGDGLTIGGDKSVMTIARGLNSAFNVQQTLTDLPNGIYAVQVSSFARVGDDPMLKYHTGEIFMNGNQNFVMTPLEDMIPGDEAVDSVNCLLSGSHADSYVADEATGIEGYVPADMIGASFAFKAGRYPNYVAVKVEDGTLTLGMRERQYDNKLWQPFANIHLYYLGTPDEASDMLSTVLKSYVGRAQTILNLTDGGSFEFDTNISQEIRGKLETAIAESETAADGAKKMELVNTFSELINEIYDCRKAYKELAQAASYIDEISTKLMESGLVTQEQAEQLVLKSAEAWEAYSIGTYTAEEARQAAKELRNNIYGPTIADDGYFELATADNLRWFSTYVNSIDNHANARMTADIDLQNEEFQPIGRFGDGMTDNVRYFGTFDGQGFVVKNLTIVGTENYEVGLFGRIADHSLIKNVGVENANITCTHNNGRVGAIVGFNLNGDVENCFSTGNLQFNCTQNSSECGGIIGGVYMSRSKNCWTSYEKVVSNDTRNGSTVSNNRAAVSTEDQKSGKLCFEMNEGAGENVFFQTLSTDAYPVPDASHLIVYKADDGTYYNEGDGIAAVRGDAQQTDAIYDLSGRRVGKARKGIYIINGRKVLK